jgi:hypothetical protein
MGESCLIDIVEFVRLLDRKRSILRTDRGAEASIRADGQAARPARLQRLEEAQRRQVTIPRRTSLK